MKTVIEQGEHKKQGHKKSESGETNSWEWDDTDGEAEGGKAKGAKGAEGADEDWADRVGEEDWTGRRIEAKKGEVERVWKGVA